jgi:hypothetical protein
MQRVSHTRFKLRWSGVGNGKMFDTMNELMSYTELWDSNCEYPYAIDAVTTQTVMVFDEIPPSW